MTVKIALVTGASRGLGAAVAEKLAAGGYHVIALARTVGALEELDDRIQKAGGTVTLVPLDITDEEGLKRLFLSIFERWGKLDVLVHSAIFAGPLSPAEHVPLGDWDKSLNVNIRATQRLIAMTDSLLKATKSSVAVLPAQNTAGDKFMASYGAAKAAQKAVWDSWAAESVNSTLSVQTFDARPMPTALRARFYPGEDRKKLTSTEQEAERLIAQIHE